MSNEKLPSLLRLDISNKDQYFDFWRKTYQHPRVNAFMFKSMHTSEKQMRELYEAYLSNSNAAFFVYLNAQNIPVGTCRVTFLTGARCHVAMINAFCVDPSVHGTGYGKGMLSAAETYIRSHPYISQIELAYEGDNQKGRNFYENRFDYQLKLTYHDWWQRFEPDLRQEYAWFAEERCCVKYLTGNVEPVKSVQVIPASYFYSVDKKYVVEHYSGKENVAAILSTYTVEEQHEIKRMIQHENEGFILTKDGEVNAFVCFRPYREPRLVHAVTVPCLIFGDEVSEFDLASFVDSAMKKYRQKHSAVFHFACSEEDTEDLFYADKMSKIEKLSLILQLAGFKFLGFFENYFNESSFVGRNLLGFERCFLDLKDTAICVDASVTLTTPQKLALVKQLDMLRVSHNQLSPHEQWEIYCLVRTVAYPQDYSAEEITTMLQKSTVAISLKEMLLRIVSEKSKPQEAFDFMGRMIDMKHVVSSASELGVSELGICRK